MRSWFMHARESFWFLPALFAGGAIVVALGLIELDRLLIGAGVSDIPLVEDLSATGGRAILGAIGGTMLGVAATSFSITISVLATTSNAYGPRLVRNFMADRGNQLVLAVLTSTFLYALIVLRSVQTEEDSSPAFVPVIAVSFAVILAVVDVAALVYFIHHIASSVQITTLQKRVLTELEHVIDVLYPEPKTVRSKVRMLDDDGTARGADSPITSFRGTRTGFVSFIEIGSLVTTAHRHDAVFRVLCRPGDYVVTGDAVIESVGRRLGHELEEAEHAVTGAITVDAARTPYQDIAFAVQQVTEIGIRGLASGTNDPYTAVSAIEALGGALATICRRPTVRTRYRDDEGVVRVICEWPKPEDLIADVYLAIRSYGMQHPLVVRAAVRLTRRLEAVADTRTREALRRQTHELAVAYLATDPAALDAADVMVDLESLEARLTARTGQ